MGTRFGCTVTAGAMATGTAKGDLRVYSNVTAQKRNYIVKKSANPAEASYPFARLQRQQTSQ